MESYHHFPIRLHDVGHLYFIFFFNERFWRSTIFFKLGDSETVQFEVPVGKTNAGLTAVKDEGEGLFSVILGWR